MYFKTILFTLCSILFICCNNSQTPIAKTKIEYDKPAIVIESPVNNATYTIGDTIHFKYLLNKENETADSIVLYLNKIRKKSLSLHATNTYFIDKNTPTGKNIFSVISYYIGKRYASSVSLVLHSDIVPEQYTYRILKSYKHDIHCYTQGLIFDKNIFYESAGMYNQSSVRRVTLDGAILKQQNVEGRYFAEGLTLLNDKLYQLTWREQTAFIYKKNDFTLLKTLPYAIGEGWGLTNDGKDLIMSDGSEIIYFLDSVNLTENKRIEIYSNKGPIRNLNELELVDDILYANIYQSDQIVKIDIKTGKVLAFIDCSGLLKDADIHSNIDVLNGIAYNSANKHFYITGKNWPKLFEVLFIKK